MPGNFFKKISDSAPCGILIYDADLKEVVYANQTFKDWGLLKTDFVKTLLSSKPKEVEFKNRFFKVKTVEDGSKLAFIVEDETPLKTYQRAKKDFVANVSHELKTPISVIQSIAETLFLEEDDPFKRKFLNRILKRTAEMEALVEDLLILAALEAQEGKVLLEKVNLREIAEEVIQNLASFAAERGIEVKNEIPEGFTCFCDAHKVGILLRNLIENAIKYNKEGGKVFVRARKENGSVLLEVEDTGIGIPQKYLPLIFERFYRVDKSRSREVRGTGLGLSIVKHIALAHGGSVSVKSKVGKGSTFTVKLPSRSETKVQRRRRTKST